MRTRCTVGIAITAYVLVGVFEFGFRLLLSRVWPGQHATSVVRLLLEFPGVVGIARTSQPGLTDAPRLCWVP